MPNTTVNKVIYGGKVLIDLTTDTVEASTLIKGATAHDKSGAAITGTCEFDANTQDADAAASEILIGKSAYARGAKVVGTMPNNEGIAETITAKAQVVKVAQGYHDGSGTVQIDETEQAKIVPGNILNGVTILGVKGICEPSSAVTAQEKTVTPSKEQQVIVPDEEVDYLSQVTVEAIPYVETDNAAGGITVTIAG